MDIVFRGPKSFASGHILNGLLVQHKDIPDLDTIPDNCVKDRDLWDLPFVVEMDQHDYVLRCEPQDVFETIKDVQCLVPHGDFSKVHHSVLPQHLADVAYVLPRTPRNSSLETIAEEIAVAYPPALTKHQIDQMRKAVFWRSCPRTIRVYDQCERILQVYALAGWHVVVTRKKDD